ncbi:glycosyltransferase family 2 protein [Sphingomonas lutea]|uniref:Glycosyltransferase family 2 protein n=1 Tax=Sphingomonas lutea TaxID=1045317 RepID=A0A7G9SI93_9SPHN|nr:glycosyltransferase family 2 protein [Sphingomonas lutea]QNN67568.1 glycosyltransferase family 2 protein [Sphingomonas lutea]
MKLIIQIPCFNEAESLPATLAALPRTLPGIDAIELLIIDDGSRDDTSGVARRWGVHHVVRHRTNRGLAAAFRSGLQRALDLGADIIVNTDADNQYEGADIAQLVAPIVAGQADVVIGDRRVRDNAHFGRVKRLLQRLGSAVVRRLSGTQVTDAVSGFRAITRSAAQRINITSDFSYTTEMLIQAGRKRMAVVSVPIRTNGAVRPSRLFSSIPQFIMNTGVTLVRAYMMYNPLRVFASIGLAAFLIGLAPMLRFAFFYFTGDGAGHVQSLVIGGVLMIVGVIAAMLGALADLIGRNRQLIEQMLERVRALESAVAAREDPAVAPAIKQRRAG